MKLLDCALIEVCAVIRRIMVNWVFWQPFYPWYDAVKCISVLLFPGPSKYHTIKQNMNITKKQPCKLGDEPIPKILKVGTIRSEQFPL